MKEVKGRRKKKANCFLQLKGSDLKVGMPRILNTTKQNTPLLVSLIFCGLASQPLPDGATSPHQCWKPEL